jgi:putative DeoR family transcriptional regulator (stage III sporulation protein D)
MSNTIKQKYSHRGFFFMKRIVTHNLPVMGNSSTVKLSIEERSVELAHYIIESKDTVRGAAKKFGISKSTVHKDVSERLKKINPSLAKQVRVVLDENKAERHIRGGMATKMKYSHLNEKKRI